MKLTEQQLKQIIKEELQAESLTGFQGKRRQDKYEAEKDARRGGEAEEDPCKKVLDLNLKLTYIYAPTDPAFASKLGPPPKELGDIEKYRLDPVLRRELVLQQLEAMKQCPDNPAEMAGTKPESDIEASS